MGGAGDVRVIGVVNDLRLINSINATLSTSLVGQTHFILGQVIVDDAAAGVETINLWLDPADLNSLPGADLSGSGDFITSTGLTSIRVESYGTSAVGAVDFFVISDSKSELLSLIAPPPVPEPSSFLLLGLGAMGLMRHTRRRRMKA